MGKGSFSWNCLLLAAYMVMMANGNAAGAGIAIMEQSPRWLGAANAGGAAAADDAATVYFNPAGLTRLPGRQASAGINLLLPSAHFRNEGSTNLTGQPLSGGEGGDPGSSAVVPNLYYSHRVNDRVTLGIGLYSPFGLSTEYDSTWVGRYYAVNSELTTLNINPAIACRITDKLSLGTGISAQYLKTELSNAIDFGTIFAALGAPGAAPQQNDGFVTFKGDSWSWGYSVGGLYEFTESTRAGIVYRSRIDHTLTGSADFSAVPSPNPTGRFLDTTVRADVTLPDSISVSLWHNFSREIAAMADITWTNWSTIDELRIRFGNPVESDAVTTVKWRDTFRYSVGAVYMPEPWSFRAGVAYDESPVPDSSHRTPRVPDSDRIWIAFGIGYRMSGSITMDAAYVHLFVKDAEIRKTATGEDRLLGALSGSYAGSVDIVGIGISWNF